MAAINIRLEECQRWTLAFRRQSSQPGVLAEMKPSSVRELLFPFSNYFKGRGVPLFGDGPVAHFREATGEWQISGIGSKVRELYRETFGLVFHGKKTALAPAQRYSLEPLRRGPEALECGDEDPVRQAELKSLKLELSGEQRLTIEKRVFDTLDALNLLALPDVTLVEARIDLKLRSRRSAVRLKICPRRDTILGETGIPVVEDWLVARGFAHRHDRALLASA